MSPIIRALGAGVLGMAMLTGCRAEPCGHAVASRDRSTAENLASALTVWRDTFGRWPTHAEGLEALLKCPEADLDCTRFPAAGYAVPEVLKDACGHRVSYRLVDHHVRLTTTGPDGKPGTPDDAVVDVPAPQRQPSSRTHAPSARPPNRSP